MVNQIELWVEGFITSLMFYPVLAGFVVLDAVFPLAPSESLITLAGAWSGSQGAPNIWGIIGIGIAAAIIGDNLCYIFGRRLEQQLKRIPPHSRAWKALDWANRNIEKRYVATIIVARFLPWARFILTILLGSQRFPWFRFFIIDTVGVILWATQAALLGYIGGWMFKDFPLIGMVFGLILAAAVGFGIEWAQQRNDKKQAAPSAVDTSTAGEET